MKTKKGGMSTQFLVWFIFLLLVLVVMIVWITSGGSEILTTSLSNIFDKIFG